MWHDASFKAWYAEVLAELSNGKTIECKTNLLADGYYRPLYSPQYNETIDCDTQIEENTIRPEESFDFQAKDYISPDEVVIKKIVKLLSTPNWEFEDEEGTLWCA